MNNDGAKMPPAPPLEYENTSPGASRAEHEQDLDRKSRQGPAERLVATAGNAADVNSSITPTASRPVTKPPIAAETNG